MSAATWWLLVPLAPLLALLGGLLHGRPLRVLWLGCVPALALAAWPVPALELPWLWDGVRWGLDDALGRAWLGFSALLWLVAGGFMAGPDDGFAARRLACCWQLCQAGNLLLILATDALSFYLGFSAMSLAAFGLIVHDGGPGPRRAGRLYLQLAVLGELALLCGLLLRCQAAGGSFAFAAWAGVPVRPPEALLLLLGLGLKAGFWPLHAWLPLAHPAAPAAASAVLSGAMLKAGLLGLWRSLPGPDPLLEAWAPGLLGVGLFGAFLAALLGLCSLRAKTALAYSSVSQMGWLLMILALAWRHPAQREALMAVLALFGAHHGLAKGALFLGVGLAHEARLSRLGWGLAALPALALAGLPLSSGAAAKLALKDVWYDGDFATALPLLGLASLATALLLARALWLMAREQPRRSVEVPAVRWAGWAVLAVLPWLLPWGWAPSREPLLGHLSLAGLWALAWPVLLGLCLVGLGWRGGWRLPAAWRGPPQPVLAWSLAVGRLLRAPPRTTATAPRAARRWRPLERRCNRLLRRDALATSGWLLALLLGLVWLL